MIKKHSILLILLLLSFGFPEIIISSSASYYFRTLGINDGLSQSTVNAILQDRKGFMWIGTKDGLNQYDGQVFRTFQEEKGIVLPDIIIGDIRYDVLGKVIICI